MGKARALSLLSVRGFCHDFLGRHRYIQIKSCGLGSPQGEGFKVSNTPEGFVELIKRLGRYEIGRVLLEATAAYERQVMVALQPADFKVLRINPRRARVSPCEWAKMPRPIRLMRLFWLISPKFRMSLVNRLISPEREVLRELIQLREHFVQQRYENKRRLQQLQQPAVVSAIKDHIHYLQAQIKARELNIVQGMFELDSEKAERDSLLARTRSVWSP